MNTAHSFSHFLRAHEQVHFHWVIQTDRPNVFQGDASARRYGEVTFSSIALDEAQGLRERSQIKPEEQFLALIRLSSGSMNLAHGNADSEVNSGDVFIWDTLKRCQFSTAQGTKCQAVLLPREWVAAHVHQVDQLAGLVLRPGSLSGTLLSSHLASLHSGIVEAVEAERQGLIGATLSLFGAATANRMRDSQCQHALFQRLLSEIQLRYSDPEFSPDDAASALQISTRYLRKILAGQGERFSDLLRKKRLQHAAIALADPALAKRSVTDIAYRAGFSDSAHFSHMIKAEFGCSPRQYRQRRLAEPG